MVGWFYLKENSPLEHDQAECNKGERGEEGEKRILTHCRRWFVVVIHSRLSGFGGEQKGGGGGVLDE